MRVETKRLLERLGQPDFKYREYEGASSASVERWPLFELVSRQLRAGRGHAPLEMSQEQDAAEADDGRNSIQALVERIAKGRDH